MDANSESINHLEPALDAALEKLGHPVELRNAISGLACGPHALDPIPWDSPATTDALAVVRALDPAAQVGSKLLLDIAWQRRLVGLARVPQKNLEMIAHGAIEDGFRRPAREARRSEARHAPLAMLGRVPVAGPRTFGSLRAGETVRVRIPVA
jgi:hypothetical protein